MNIHYIKQGTKEVLHITKCEFVPKKGDKVNIYEKDHVVKGIRFVYGISIRKVEVYLSIR